jgi:hypothetical protein
MAPFKISLPHVPAHFRDRFEIGAWDYQKAKLWMYRIKRDQLVKNVVCSN